jgi:(p)ppGpp synthase/HD superfamily hydrolase
VLPPLWSQDGYVRAHGFAARAHQGQTLPGSDLPYVLHVQLVSMEVMAALTAEPGLRGDLAVQCALLHDVVEDTPVTVEQVEEAFGADVAAGVLALSKDPALPKGARMEDSLRRIRRQPHEIWVVKLADRITNMQPPPVNWTSAKAAEYRDEARRILDALGDASPMLAARLRHKIETYPLEPLPASPRPVGGLAPDTAGRP